MAEKYRCRLCLAYDELNYIDIFSPEVKEQKFTEKVYDCLQIHLLENDSFPKQVCVNCYTRVDSFSCYKEQCQLNQTVFSIYSGKSNVEEAVEMTDIQNVPATEESSVSKTNTKDDETKVAGFHFDDDDSGSPEDDKEDDAPPEYSSLSELSIPHNFPKTLIRNTRLIVNGRALMNLISRFYRLECYNCPKQTTTYKDIFTLMAHYRQSHQMKGYVICCGTKFIKPKAMAMHMARHIQPEAFRCNDCGKIMTSPKILKEHKGLHLPETLRKFACKHCPRRFAYNSALLAHSILHVSEDQRKLYPCTECNKTYYSSGRLSTHMSHAHVKLGSEFICHICAKQFACKSNLAYHLKTHQPVQLAQCKECGKWLRNNVCLRKHLTQHSNFKHQCQLCSYSAVNVQCLKNHMRTKHSNDKPFQCPHCDKSFKLKNTLVSHIAQHTGERRFSCEFCNRKFVSSGNYYAHRKRMHAGQVKEMLAKKEVEEELKRKEYIGKVT